MTISAVLTKTSTNRFSESHRAFETENLKADFFGMFLVAIKARKQDQGLTQDELARRLGKDKTGTSKLLSGPRNWQISTIADLAVALDLDIEVALVDKTNSARRFTPTGEQMAPELPTANSVYCQGSFVNNVSIANNVSQIVDFHNVVVRRERVDINSTFSSVWQRALAATGPDHVVPMRPVTGVAERFRAVRDMVAQTHANH